MIYGHGKVNAMIEKLKALTKPAARTDARWVSGPDVAGLTVKIGTDYGNCMDIAYRSRSGWIARRFEPNEPHVQIAKKLREIADYIEQEW